MKPIQHITSKLLGISEIRFEFRQRVSPPSLWTRLYIDRHHHSDIDRERVNQPFHVSFCLLEKNEKKKL